MKTDTLSTQVASKTANLKALAERVAKHPELLGEIFDGLAANQARTKYGCLKLLRVISETRPDIIYPEIDRVISLLDSENNIFKWGSAIILGHLATVDSDGKIDRVLDKYLQPISGDTMITAAHVMRGAAHLALAQPHLADRIACAILQVETATYQTAECRNVASGHAVEALDLLFDRLKKPKPVLDFVRRQLENPRNAVRKKAARFLRNHPQAA